MTDNIQQLDSDDGLNVVQIDGTVIEPMLPAFDKINTNFETVLTDTTADATTKADAAEAAAKAYADGIVATEASARESADLTLQSNIDAEQTRAEGVESVLRTDVDSLQAQVTANDSDILSLQSLVGSDVSDLQSQLDAEVARATTAEGDNANAIIAEVNRATDAETVLQSNIDAEAVRAIGIEQGLRTDVDSVQAQVTANDSDIAALQTLQSGDVSGLQSQLDAEVTRATGIESGLRVDVDTVTGRVDTLIGSSPETLDTIQEIVAAFEDADSDLQQVIDNNSSRLTSAESDIDAVEVRATDLESRATTTESDVSTAQGEISTLQSEMNTVEGRATSLESRMTSAETDVSSIEVRTTDLETIVTQTQSKVGTGSFDTTAQDNVGAINEVHTELDATVSRVDGQDTTVADLQTQITAEVNRATAQESTILSELAASSGVLDNQNSSGNPIKLWTGTQSQYSALTPDPDTLYFITG